MKELIKKILRESDFDWTEKVGYIPDDYESILYNVYKDDSGYGFMEEWEFINKEDRYFNCDDYEECPRSVAEITIYYPEDDEDADHEDLMKYEIMYDKPYESGEYVWDKDQDKFVKTE